MTVDWDRVADKLKHAADDMKDAAAHSKPAQGEPDEELAILAEEIEDLYARVRTDAARFERATERGS